MFDVPLYVRFATVMFDGGLSGRTLIAYIELAMTAFALTLLDVLTVPAVSTVNASAVSAALRCLMPPLNVPAPATCRRDDPSSDVVPISKRLSVDRYNPLLPGCPFAHSAARPDCVPKLN